MMQHFTEKEEAFAIHERLIQLAINDNRLVSERTSMFLLASSFLFTGFVLSAERLAPLSIVLAVAGMVLCGFQALNIGSIYISQLFWLNRARQIERRKLSAKWTVEDLSPISSWIKFLADRKKVQEAGQLSVLRHWVLFKIFSPAKFFQYFMPGLFFLVWVVLLVLIPCVAVWLLGPLIGVPIAALVTWVVCKRVVRKKTSAD